MKVRAVICDVYQTILDVSAPPLDAGARWDWLCTSALGRGIMHPGFSAFGDKAREIILRERSAAQAAGIPYPEIYWPAVAIETWPELSRLSPTALDEFLAGHALLQHTVSLMPGAGELLGRLARDGVVLGIVSNAQPYTLRELDAALTGAVLTRDIFHPSLRFFSFEAGFSKPDPHVFRWLAARLHALGIAAPEALVVGDRQDNDVAPAQAQGFQTWHFNIAKGDSVTGGNWFQLADRLSETQ